jgi:hypothetical protein
VGCTTVSSSSSELDVNQSVRDLGGIAFLLGSECRKSGRSGVSRYFSLSILDPVGELKCAQRLQTKWESLPEGGCQMRAVTQKFWGSGGDS